MDDEDFEVDATDLAKGDSGDLGDVVDGAVVDSRAGSLGHLRNVSFTTKAVMAPRTHTHTAQADLITTWSGAGKKKKEKWRARRCRTLGRKTTWRQHHHASQTLN